MNAERESAKKSHADGFAVVGELVLISNALDHLLAEVLIDVLELTRSTMLLPVIITLDPARKIEILKRRAVHINQSDWKKGLKNFAECAEKVFQYRNIVCHTQPILVEDDWTLQPFAAAKVLRDIDVSGKRIKTVGMDELKAAITLGERALGAGVTVMENFQRANAEKARRAAARQEGI